MPRERRQFSDEFKREAVRLAYERGRRLSDVARELDVGTNLIRRWRRKFAGIQEGRAPTTEQQEIVRLQGQLSRIREERELCCDDIAASSCGDPIRYARALAELEGCRHPAPLALAATGGAGAGELMARVRRLAGLPVRRRAGRRSWTAPPALGLALVLGLADRGLSPDQETGAPEPPVVAVSADGKLIQIPAGIPVVLRNAGDP